MTTARSSWILAAFVFLSCNGKWFATEPNKDNCTTEPGAVACTEMGGVCDQTTGRCRIGNDGSCKSAVDCSMGSAAWCKEGQCVPCDVDTRCIVWSNERNVTPRREWCANLTSSPNTCAQCRPGQEATDCTDNKNPICDSKSGLCRGCQKDSECASGICRKPNDYPMDSPVTGLVTGQCVLEGNIAYVNNTGTPTCAAGNPGTPGQPVCSIMDAKMNLPSKPYIRLTGSATAYAVPAINTGNLVVVGPGRSASPPAKIVSTVNVGGGSLVLTGVQIDLTNVLGVPAVICNSGSFYLLESSLVSEQRGISGNGCSMLVIERSRIKSVERGVVTGNGTYRIANSAFASDSVGGATGQEEAVFLGSGSTGYFGFNTITRYLAGILCANSQEINDSIIATNGADVTNCTYLGRRIVTDKTKVELSAGLEPTLANKGAKNLACCIDQSPTPTGNQPITTDYFGTARPNGEAYDIGFHEIE